MKMLTISILERNIVVEVVGTRLGRRAATALLATTLLATTLLAAALLAATTAE
jgi:hypothetical protein